MKDKPAISVVASTSIGTFVFVALDIIQAGVTLVAGMAYK